MTPQERIAPDGQVWVCHACGKIATDKYGIEGEHSRGWDEACMLNSELHKKDDLMFEDGRVIAVAPFVKEK